MSIPVIGLHSTPRVQLAAGGDWLPLDLDRWSGWLLGVFIVLLIYQQWRLYRFRQEAARREELFRIVAENAADMIALVDVKGRRLYNSPAYEKVLGYTAAELAKTSSFQQIHQEDRFKVLEAAREARRTGVGKKLEYRVQHKNGSWRTLESIASTIRNREGEVEKLVIVNRDITERKRAEEQLEHNSFHDSLTGLPNRRLFLDRLQHARARAQRNPSYRYGVLAIDVDRFGAINETMGRAAADGMILEIARRLDAGLRQDDTVSRPKGKLPLPDPLLSRMGGDEFTILLEGMNDPSDALRVAKRLQSLLAEPWLEAGREVLAAVSVGIALSTSPHERSEDLLQDADTAMRRAKAMGGSRCEVFDEGMHSQAMNRLQLEAELRTAIDEHQFELYYQPILHLSSKQITGFEALLRWRHPREGIVSADKFIAVAEDVGLVVTVGKWVLDEACRRMQLWREKFPALDSMNMTVNLSSKQLAHANLVADIKAAVRRVQLDPSQLQVEISESTAMADAQLTYGVLSELKCLGVRASLAEFASGYSSLGWLGRFPIDQLKIDRGVAGSVLTDRHSNDIVKLVVTLAAHLKSKVAAEGIESAVQLGRLEALGCELGQGYLFSHPIEAAKAEELLRQQVKRAAAGK